MQRRAHPTCSSTTTAASRSGRGARATVGPRARSTGSLLRQLCGTHGSERRWRLRVGRQPAQHPACSRCRRRLPGALCIASPTHPRRACCASLSRDVPSFLQYPDGSHALGVISPSAVGSGRVADDEAGTAAQSGSIMGSFIVWADPTPPTAAGNRLHLKGLFFGLLMIDLVVCVLMLPGAAEALRTSSNRAGPSPSPDISPYVMFFTGLFFKLVGAWVRPRPRVQRVLHADAPTRSRMLLHCTLVRRRGAR